MNLKQRLCQKFQSPEIFMELRAFPAHHALVQASQAKPVISGSFLDAKTFMALVFRSNRFKNAQMRTAAIGPTVPARFPVMKTTSLLSQEAVIFLTAPMWRMEVT